MAKPKLTNADFCRAAKRLRCDVAAIKAVAFVESRGEGFYSDGFPVILFERHKFKSFTQGRYNSTHPHLSGPQGGYGKAGQNQRNKFNQAFALNPTAAMKSCSWGKFQIMGFNHAICGFSSVGAFVDAMKESEGKQLDAFVEFVISNNLARHLRNLDWAAFARGYNGAGYKANKYDTKMASAYARFSKENIDCSSSVAASTAEGKADHPAGAAAGNPPQSGPANTIEPPPIDGNSVEQTVVESPEGTTVATTTTESGTVSLNAPEKDGATAASTKMVIAGVTVPPIIAGVLKAISDAVSQGYVSAAEIGSFLMQFLRDNIKWVLVLFGLVIILLIVKKIVKQVTFWLQMLTHAIPGWNSIEVQPVPVEPKKGWLRRAWEWVW